MVGIFVGGQPRHGVAAEKPDRSGLSHRRRSDLSVPDEAVLSAPHLATSPPSERLACRPGDCRAVACPRHLAKSAVFLLGASRRTRSIPCLPLVLFHQRAGAPLPEPALPARLQYGPPSVVLAASFRLVVSLERILSRPRQAFLQTAGPRRPNTTARAVLERIHPRLFHVLDDTGILFDALLSGVGVAARLGDGHGRSLGSTGNARSLCRSDSCRAHDTWNLCCRAPSAYPRRHLAGPRPPPWRLHAVVGPHVGPYVRFLRLLAAALACGFAGVSCRGHRNVSLSGRALFPGGSRDDDHLFSRRTFGACGL